MSKLNYRKSGEILIPDLELRGARPLGKYGRMRRDFLRTHRQATWNAMISAGSLSSHLSEIDGTAREQIERVTAQLAQRSGVDAAMKKRDQMGWVQAMNSLKAQAEEQVIRELILA